MTNSLEATNSNDKAKIKRKKKQERRKQENYQQPLGLSMNERVNHESTQSHRSHKAIEASER